MLLFILTVKVISVSGSTLTQRLHFLGRSPSLDEALAEAKRIATYRSEKPDAADDDFIAVQALTIVKDQGRCLGRFLRVGDYYITVGKSDLCDLR